jgi:urease accessory protein
MPTIQPMPIDIDTVPNLVNPPHPEESVAAGWRAQLELRYGTAKEKTFLLSQRHSGPLMVQKPFYPEGQEICHTYLIHPPGGVVGGDRLGLTVSVNANGHALITTPAAGKFYRSAGPRASQHNLLEVSAGAALEWLPQETIVYHRAHAKLCTEVRLKKDARFIGWELNCLGLPASQQPFTQGRLDQRTEVFQDDRPLFSDSLRVQGADPVLTANWGLARRPVTGTLVATVGDAELLAALRKQAKEISSPGLFAATQFNGLTICRFLGNDVYVGFQYFLRAWEVLRPSVIGRKACPPRIWAT